MKGRPLFLLAACLALAALVVFNVGEPRQGRSVAPTASPTPSGSGPGFESPSPPAPSTQARAPLAEAIASKPEARHPASAPSDLWITGTLQSTSGTPIADCEVSITSLTNTQAQEIEAGARLNAKTLAAQTQTSQTQSSGRFRLPGPDGMGVVWVTHRGHRASATVLGRDPATRKRDLGLIVLESAPPISVHVTSAGLPAPMAWVVQRTRAPGLPKERLAAGTFLRRTRTDATGTTTVVPTGLEEQIWAHNELERSTVWRGKAKPNIELELHPTATLFGHVIVEGRAPRAPNFGTVQVLAEDVRGQHLVEALSLDASLAFGPIEVPATVDLQLVARLRINGFATVEVAPGPATAGDSIEVVLTASPSEPIAFDVGLMDAPDDEPWKLPGAKVTVAWVDPEGRRIEAHAIANEDGTATFTGLPQGRVWPRAEAPEHVSFETEPVDLPWGGARNPVVWLLDGGKIDGTCSRNGKPEADFQVFAWNSGSGQYHADLTVRGAEDGHFESDMAPLGSVTLLAVGLDGARSREAVVDVSRTQSATVLLKLEATGLLKGQVVDANNGKPIATARITPLTTAGDNTSASGSSRDGIGLEFPVDHDGTFERACLGAGPNVVRISAEGFTPVTQRFDPKADGSFDLGRIQLGRRGTLRVHADLPERFSLDRLQVFFAGPEPVPPTTLDASGEVALADAAAGEWTVYVVDQETGAQWMKTRRVSPASATTIQFNLSAGCTLDIQLELSGRSALPGDFMVRLDGFDPAGDSLTLIESPDSAYHCRFPSVGSGPVRILAISQEGPPFGVSYFHIEADESERAVSVSLSSEPTHVEVVDPEGAPIPGVRVCLLGKTPATNWGYPRITDSDGRCTFFGVTHELTQIRLLGPGGERAEGLVQDLIPGDRELNSLVLDARGRLAFILTTPGLAPEAVTAYLQSPTRPGFAGPPHHPNGDGTLMFTGLNQVPFTLSLEGPGIWPTLLSFTPTPDFPTRPLKLLASIDCALIVRTHQDLPAAGVSLDLVHLALESDQQLLLSPHVATWLDEARASAGPTGLTTTDDGRIELHGIPEGTYRWSTETGANGTVELASGATVIQLPE